MSPPPDKNELVEVIRGAADATMRGVGVVHDTVRARVRENMRPELQALGIDHIDPFTPGGQLRLQKARNARAAEARAASAAANEAHWDAYDRSMRLTLSQRYPDYETDTTPIDLDEEGRPARRRWRPLESYPDTPPELLHIMPEDGAGVGGGQQ